MNEEYNIIFLCVKETRQGQEHRKVLHTSSLCLCYLHPLFVSLLLTYTNNNFAGNCRNSAPDMCVLSFCHHL